MKGLFLLDKELKKQEKRIVLCKEQINVLENDLRQSDEQIKFHKGWVKFREEAIGKHIEKMELANNDGVRFEQKNKIEIS